MKVEDKTLTKTIGKIVKILFFIIATPILILSLIIMIKARIYPDKVPDVFGYKPMIVLSGSMETSIYTGDLVFVKIVDTNILKEDDIIAFRNETNTVTTHRIVELVNENGNKLFRTKGDNNNTEDAKLVLANEVEGVYVFKISGLGNVLMFLKEPKSLIILLLATLVLGLIWIQIMDKIENKNKIQEDEKYKKEFEEFKKMQQEKERQQQNE